MQGIPLLYSNGFRHCSRTTLAFAPAAANNLGMADRFLAHAAVVAFVCLAAGNASVAGQHAAKTTKPGMTRIDICHGFGCHFRSSLDLGRADGRRFSRIMAAGASSPKAERAAVSRAVRYYEDRAAGVVGIRDQPKSIASQYHRRGQMDCVDESTNTRSLLLYLERRGLLKHHTVDRKVTRGFLLDGRYPHATAVLRDRSGTKWAIDSWYEPAGGPPDIRPLSEWLKRGVMGVR
jgi:hypothetical protein